MNSLTQLNGKVQPLLAGKTELKVTWEENLTIYIYSTPPLSTGNLFQDLQWQPEIAGSTKRYICRVSYKYCTNLSLKKRYFMASFWHI